MAKKPEAIKLTLRDEDLPAPSLGFGATKSRKPSPSEIKEWNAKAGLDYEEDTHRQKSEPNVTPIGATGAEDDLMSKIAADTPIHQNFTQPDNHLRPKLPLGPERHARIYGEAKAREMGGTPDHPQWNAVVNHHAGKWNELSDAEKLGWQRSPEGKKATAEGIAQAKAERAARDANPENKKSVAHLENNLENQTSMRVRQQVWTGENELAQGSIYTPEAKQKKSLLEQGVIPSGRRIEFAAPEEKYDPNKTTEIPGTLADKGRRHAIGSEDPRPSIEPERFEAPAAARYFGFPDSFEHHRALETHINKLVADSKGGNNEMARAGITAASGQLSFHEPRTSVSIATPAEHHANKALQYLTASAQAHSLGMRDIAMENFANATQHAKYVQQYAGRKAATGAAVSNAPSLSALLGGQTQAAPAANNQSVETHFENYRNSMRGVR